MIPEHDGFWVAKTCAVSYLALKPGARKMIKESLKRSRMLYRGAEEKEKLFGASEWSDGLRHTRFRTNGL